MLTLRIIKADAGGHVGHPAVHPGPIPRRLPENASESRPGYAELELEERLAESGSHCRPSARRHAPR